MLKNYKEKIKKKKELSSFYTQVQGLGWAVGGRKKVEIFQLLRD